MKGKREELRREVMTVLLAMNLSQSKEGERTKTGKKRTPEKRGPQFRFRKYGLRKILTNVALSCVGFPADERTP
jgi:hypothetical protein